MENKEREDYREAIRSAWLSLNYGDKRASFKVLCSIMDQYSFSPHKEQDNAPPSPAIEGKEEDEDDGYEGPTPEQMNKYMQGVKFLLAYYGHNKAYIECREKDKGAINVGDGWVQEFDIAVGVNLRDRHFKFAVQKKLVQIGLSNDILKPLIKWLLAYKNSDDEQPHTEGN